MIEGGIIHFIDTGNAGGAERIVSDLGTVQRERGERVGVMHFGNRWLEGRCREQGLQSIPAPAERHYRNRRAYPRFAAALYRRLRRLRPGVLHSHLYGPATAAALPARMAGVPHVATFHDTYTIEEKPSRFHLVRAAGLLGTSLVAVSQHMAGYFNDLAGAGPGRFDTVYNGTAGPSGLIDSARRQALRRELGVDSDQLLVLNVGRLVPIKNQLLLLRALVRCRARPRLRLCIAGDGPEQDRLNRAIRRLGLERCATLAGFRDDVRELMTAADLFALSSDSEGLSCSIIEAMAAGVPAVVTDVGGNRELVDDEVSGLITPPGNAQAFAAALDRMAEDDLLRRRFASAAQRRARNQFSLEAMAEEYERLYRQSFR